MNAPAAFPPPPGPGLARAGLPDWPRLMRVELAAAYLSIGATMLRRHGPDPRRIGGCVVWDRRDLDRWADALAGAPLDAAQREEEGSEMLRRIRERLGDG